MRVLCAKSLSSVFFIMEFLHNFVRSHCPQHVKSFMAALQGCLRCSSGGGCAQSSKSVALTRQVRFTVFARHQEERQLQLFSFPWDVWDGELEKPAFLVDYGLATSTIKS